MESFDAIVVGLGAHGSAAVASLARRGQRVLGLERFGRGEAFGSSGGWSRMIRLVYFEDPSYVPLARASWDRWRDLEREADTGILTQTGGLYAGPADSRPVAGAIRSAQEHRLAHEVLDADEIHRRWPIFEPAPDTVGLAEEQAGALRIDRANAAHLAVAERHGARLAFGRQVVAWQSTAGGHEGTVFYGMPHDPDLGLKVSIHHWGTFVGPDEVERVVSPADVERVRSFLRTRMPAANGPLASAMVCFYTNTPDDGFVIDRHPTARGVAFASACSGHGFKFAPLIGDILADLVMGQPTT